MVSFAIDQTSLITGTPVLLLHGFDGSCIGEDSLATQSYFEASAPQYIKLQKIKLPLLSTIGRDYEVGLEASVLH